jgi:hypothetical protein
MVKYIIMFPKTLKDKNIEIILFELLAQYDFILGGTDEGTKVCGGKRHPGSKSPFPVNRVPLEYFEKKGKEELLKTCLHCREKQKLADNRYKKKMKELAKDVKEKGDGKFLACPSKEHLTKVKSKFPRDKVPINLFQSEPNNPKIIC